MEFGPDFTLGARRLQIRKYGVTGAPHRAHRNEIKVVCFELFGRGGHLSFALWGENIAVADIGGPLCLGNFLPFLHHVMASLGMADVVDLKPRLGLANE